MIMMFSNNFLLIVLYMGYKDELLTSVIPFEAGRLTLPSLAMRSFTSFNIQAAFLCFNFFSLLALIPEIKTIVYSNNDHWYLNDQDFPKQFSDIINNQWAQHNNVLMACTWYCLRLYLIHFCNTSTKLYWCNF